MIISIETNFQIHSVTDFFFKFSEPAGSARIADYSRITGHQFVAPMSGLSCVPVVVVTQ